jgi:hypothetical protein
MIKVKVKPAGAKHVEVLVYAEVVSATPVYLGSLHAKRGHEAQDVVARLSNDYRDPVLELEGCLELPDEERSRYRNRNDLLEAIREQEVQ